MVLVVLMVRGWRVLTFCRPRDSLLTGYPSHARASTGFTLHTDCNVLLTTTSRDSLVSPVLSTLSSWVYLQIKIKVLSFAWCFLRRISLIFPVFVVGNSLVINFRSIKNLPLLSSAHYAKYFCLKYWLSGGGRWSDTRGKDSHEKLWTNLPRLF